MRWSPSQEIYQLYLNAVLAGAPDRDWISSHQLRGWAEKTCSPVALPPVCLLLGATGIPQGEGHCFCSEERTVCDPQGTQHGPRFRVWLLVTGGQ